MFVHHNGHEKNKETSDFKKLLISKKEYGSKNLAMKKVCKQGKRSLQIVWKRVRDGDRGSLKSEMELKDH